MKILVFWGVLFFTAYTLAQANSDIPVLSPSKPGVFLKNSEKEVLKKGRISTVRHVTGGIVGTIVGFGAGHTIQSRYKESGWHYTVADIVFASLVLMGKENKKEGASSFDLDSSNSSQIVRGIGVVGLLTSRIFQFIDVWYFPPSWNEKYFKIKNKSMSKKSAIHYYLIPQRDQLQAGLYLTF